MVSPLLFAVSAIQQRMSSAFSTGDPIFDGFVTSFVIFFFAACASNGHILIKYLQWFTETHILGRRNTFTLTISRDEKHPVFNYSTLRNVDYEALTWFLTHCLQRGFRANHAKISCVPKQTISKGKAESKSPGDHTDTFVPAVNHPISIDLDPVYLCDHREQRAHTYTGKSEDMTEQMVNKMPVSIRRVACRLGLYSKTLESAPWTIGIILKENRNEPKESDQEIVYNVRMEVSMNSSDGHGLLKLRRFVTRVRHDYLNYLTSQEWKQQLFKLKRPVPTSSSSQEKKMRWSGHPTHSNKTFDKIVLDQSLKNDIVEDLETFLNSETWYNNMGVSYKRGYMFCGPPGTGKTSAVMAISGRAQYDIYSLDLSKILSDEELDEAFEMLPEKCVVLMEDIDCMTEVVKRRSDNTTTENCNRDSAAPHCSQEGISSTINQQVKLSYEALHLQQFDNIKQQPKLTLSALLNNIDGASNNHGRIFIMTSNHPETLDPALLRFGRVDMLVPLCYCSHEQIHQFFRLYYPDHSQEYLTECAAELCAFPPETFSPAEVSSTMQHFKTRPQNATRNIKERALS